MFFFSTKKKRPQTSCPLEGEAKAGDERKEPRGQARSFQQGSLWNRTCRIGQKIGGSSGFHSTWRIRQEMD